MFIGKVTTCLHLKWITEKKNAEILLPLKSYKNIYKIQRESGRNIA